MTEKLRNRLIWLVLSAVLGLIIAYLFYENQSLFGISELDKLIISNLTLLCLSLPVLVLLWFYRTHDVQEQIDKAQSNINTNLFNKGIDLLLTKDTRENNLVNSNVNKRSAGLRMLVKLRHQEETLRQQIDALTNGVDLSDAHLYGADLSNADLFYANLENADLQGANLRGTDLLQADLSNAKLDDADLRAENLDGVILQDTQYSKDTKFPEGFDPERAGMKISWY